MYRAKQEIFVVDVIDIYRISVGPAHGPGLSNQEPVAAILEAWTAFDNHRLADREGMLPAEIGMKAVIRNMSATLSFPRVRLVVMSFVLTSRLLSLLPTPIVSVSILARLPVTRPV